MAISDGLREEVNLPAITTKPIVVRGQDDPIPAGTAFMIKWINMKDYLRTKDLKHCASWSVGASDLSNPVRGFIRNTDFELLD